MKQDPDLKHYAQIIDELSIARDIVLRGSRIVIPTSLIKKVICIGHEGHQGIVKMKQFLRSTVWFLNMDYIIEKHIGKCMPCQASVNNPVQDPVKSSPLPDYPWQYIDIDFLGPLPSGHYVMVAIDEYSRFPEIFITRSTAFESTVSNLDKLFSSYGIPEVVKTDNGPPFNSKHFKRYSKYMGFRHRRITPLHPKANGLVENFNRMIIKILKIARIECLPWVQELYTFLRNYRATVHLSTGKSPAELFFPNRPFRTRLGNFQDYCLKDAEVRDHERKQKLKAKAYADKKSYVKYYDLGIGDYVLLKIRKINKLTPNYDPIPYIVTAKKGSMITAERRHPFHTVTRDISYFKKLKYTDTPDDFDVYPGEDNPITVPLRRSQRSTRPPIRYPENDINT